jgi:adenosylhomocysteine nucleosidase
MNLLLAQVQQPQRHSVNGVAFTTGLLQGKPVVLFHSGISMTNAAMNTQLVLDRFKVTHMSSAALPAA